MIPSLPNELVAEIAGYLPLKDLASFAQVSKSFDEIANTFLYQILEMPSGDHFDWNPPKGGGGKPKLDCPKLLSALRVPEHVRYIRLHLAWVQYHAVDLERVNKRYQSNCGGYFLKELRISVIPFSRVTRLELSGLERYHLQDFNIILIQIFNLMPGLVNLKVYSALLRLRPIFEPQPIDDCESSLGSDENSTARLKSFAITNINPAGRYSTMQKMQEGFLSLLVSEPLAHSLSTITALELRSEVGEVSYLFQNVELKRLEKKLSFPVLENLTVSVTNVGELSQLPFTEDTFKAVKRLVLPVAPSEKFLLDLHTDVLSFPNLTHLVINVYCNWLSVSQPTRVWTGLSSSMFSTNEALRIIDFQISENLVFGRLGTARYFRQTSEQLEEVPNDGWEMVPDPEWDRDITHMQDDLGEEEGGSEKTRISILRIAPRQIKKRLFAENDADEDAANASDEADAWTEEQRSKFIRALMDS